MSTKTDSTSENAKEDTTVTEASSNERQKPSFLAVVTSVIAAAFGVQSQEKLEKDFAGSSPLPFIIVGVVFTALFVISLIVLVRFIVGNIQ